MLNRFNCRSNLWCPAALAAFFVVTAFLPTDLSAQEKYSPEHYEVEQMARKGIAFIENSLDRRSGFWQLQALAICETIKRYENRVPIDRPFVAGATLAADQNTLLDTGEAFDDNTMYGMCVSSILLGIVDKERYEPNIQACLRLIEKRQMAQGCWKYKVEGGSPNLGDTSQTQYCCLAIWAASNCGFVGNPDVANRALNWLFQTQTSNGGWVYRAISGQQNAGGETLSISTAGAGALYMMLDALGAKNGSGSKRAKRASADLPEFITVYDPAAEVANDNSLTDTPKVKIDEAAATAGTQAANKFIGQIFSPNPPEWTYYYLYSFERYAYFREQADGQVFETPDWYDQGVDFLKSTQQPDGSWHSTSVGDSALLPAINTAFAVLFLVRSTELLAGEKATGIVYGQSALPKGNVEVRNGKVIGQTIEANISDFLIHVEKGDMDIKDYANSLSPDKIVLPADPAERELYSAKLRVLVTDVDAYKRLVAVRALSQSRELSNVPALILAMNDEEADIKTAAHIGLRFISRKMNSIKLADNPNDGDFLAARKQWIDWYKSIRPNDRLLVE